MKKDYLTTNIELLSVKTQVAYKEALKDLEEIDNLTTEVEILKFIATKLIRIEQKLNEL